MNSSSKLTEHQAMVALEVRVAKTKEDLAWCQQALEAEHRLGKGQPAGKRLWQMVSRVGGPEPVAVVVWAASAWHLKRRDEWIGWDAMTRSERLGLIVNNTRLLILEKSREPNLATQVLGAALRALVAQWEQSHGYRPLLAEAFTDLETHHGTSYKASNWIALGQTAGYGRHSADFYERHDRPKRLWIYPLDRAAAARLCAPQLATEHAAAEIAPTVRCALSFPQLRSLKEVFEAMNDPRRINSRRYRLSLMLSLLSLGLLCGAQSLSDILRSVQLLSQRERKVLGLPRKKQSQAYRVPCYNAFRELLPMIDLAQMLELLTCWLSQHEGTLPRTLALDGKDLGRDLGLIVSLINTTESGRGEEPGLEHDGTPTPPVAMAVAAGKGHEQAAAQQLMARAEVDLRGALLTADALHCQHATLHQIVALKGGDYLISLKDNQPKAAEYAREVLAEAPLFIDNKAHGRLTQHAVRVVAVEAETIGLPFAQAVISVTRTCQKTCRGKPEESSGVRYFVTSLDPKKQTHAQWAELVRGHWSIENKNHWKRDALWREDAPRLRNPKSAQVLAVLRGAILALCRQPAPKLFALHRRSPLAAFRLINSPLKPFK